jgi:hypothetical protein
MGLVRLSRRSRYLSLTRIHFCSKPIYFNLRTWGAYVYKSYLITVSILIPQLLISPPLLSSSLLFSPLLLSSPSSSPARVLLGKCASSRRLSWPLTFPLTCLEPTIDDDGATRGAA